MSLWQETLASMPNLSHDINYLTKKLSEETLLFPTILSSLLLVLLTFSFSLPI